MEPDFYQTTVLEQIRKRQDDPGDDDKPEMVKMDSRMANALFTHPHVSVRNGRALRWLEEKARVEKPRKPRKVYEVASLMDFRRWKEEELKN